MITLEQLCRDIGSVFELNREQALTLLIQALDQLRTSGATNTFPAMETGNVLDFSPEKLSA